MTAIPNDAAAWLSAPKSGKATGDVPGTGEDAAAGTFQDALDAISVPPDRPADGPGEALKMAPGEGADDLTVATPSGDADVGADVELAVDAAAGTVTATPPGDVPTMDDGAHAPIVGGQTSASGRPSADDRSPVGSDDPVIPVPTRPAGQPAGPPLGTASPSTQAQLGPEAAVAGQVVAGPERARPLGGQGLGAMEGRSAPVSDPPVPASQIEGRKTEGRAGSTTGSMGAMAAAAQATAGQGGQTPPGSPDANGPAASTLPDVGDAPHSQGEARRATGDPAVLPDDMPDRLAAMSDPKATTETAQRAAERLDAPTRATVPIAELRAGVEREIRSLTERLPADIAHEARPGNGKQTEIELAPADLGRLRITLQTGERGLQLQIAVERPETVEVVRRHLEGLQRDLLANGVELAGFDLGADLAGRSQSDEDAPASTNAAPASDQPVEGPALPSPQRPTVSPGRLNIIV